MTAAHVATSHVRAAQRARSARLVREGLGVLSSKWSVGVLLALGEGTKRYHQLLGELEPISEKVLTQTLRAMERDGLIARHVHPEVPPRVEYALTPLGSSLAGPLRALGTWALTHGQRVEQARERYDAQTAQRRDAAQVQARGDAARGRPRII
jgi:DNA-binding HxlR family transcriptional regulator